MSTSNEKVISWLFETNAVRICPQNKPFWYTSGTIGPYYINTHFLYGSEEKANDLLKVIDTEKNSLFSCPVVVYNAIRRNYNHDEIYRGLMDELIFLIKDQIDVSEIDCISGGERRDWFFSVQAAAMLDKPHITIYKDLKSVISFGDKVGEVDDLKGKKILHIADLITEASSYERAWIPVIRNLGGEIKWSFVVVDRMQGGAAYLKKEGVKPFSMINIEKELFKKALSMGLINKEQLAMILDYIDDPKESMKNFILTHPEFLKNALKSDEKTVDRARLLIEKRIYGDFSDLLKENQH